MMLTFSCRALPWAICCITCLGSVPRSWGDVFRLRSGGSVRGTWLNPEESSLSRYAVRAEGGIVVQLPVSHVTEHVREPADTAEYERIAPQHRDTVDDQWKLAEWCRERKLENERRIHLRRIVELDPRHAGAWQGLGYSEIKGKWITRKDSYEDRGYVFSRGRWRTPQEVDVFEEQRRVDRLQRDWIGRLKTWREMLGTERDGDAARPIAGIRDPHALKALAQNLHRDRSPRARLLYATALAHIQDSRAAQMLVVTALNDRDPEVFFGCVDQLVKMQSPSLTKHLVETLQNSSNVRINRAAHILGRKGDQRVIPALIESLVTTHYLVIPGTGRTSVTMVAPVNLPPPGRNGALAANGPAAALPGVVPAGATAFATGSSSQVVFQQAANQGVLQALVRLSEGQSFGFDQRAWRNWWSSSRAELILPSLRAQ